MVVLDCNFVLGRGPGTDYPQINIFQCMLERTDAITKEILEPITFVLAYPTVLTRCCIYHTSYQTEVVIVLVGQAQYFTVYTHTHTHTHTHIYIYLFKIATLSTNCSNSLKYRCRTVRNITIKMSNL